ncbi:hypothetical protein HNP38_003169 [Chryseobacterium defluvii]|uniref:Prokaryotic STING domain-containing protein n=1 Tax=Chryseobacterium defluvii TaxID=160396 RepID=A0A840KK10_9FLAO|nr:STING domain-containing protein [Chryseobacterium defluvii]MBB4807853.1 hypothetical protein [Chryseobacterium defluvii]
MIELIGFIMGAICFPITIFAFYFQIRGLKRINRRFAKILAWTYYHNFLNKVIASIISEQNIIINIDSVEHTFALDKITIEIRIPLSIKTTDERKIKNPINLKISEYNFVLDFNYNKEENSITIIEFPNIFTALTRFYKTEEKNDESIEIYKEAKLFKDSLEKLIDKDFKNVAYPKIKILLVED